MDIVLFNERYWDRFDILLDLEFEFPSLETYRRTYRRWTVLVVPSGIDGKMREIVIPAPPAS